MRDVRGLSRTPNVSKETYMYVKCDVHMRSVKRRIYMRDVRGLSRTPIESKETYMDVKSEVYI